MEPNEAALLLKNPKEVEQYFKEFKSQNKKKLKQLSKNNLIDALVELSVQNVNLRVTLKSINDQLYPKEEYTTYAESEPSTENQTTITDTSSNNP